MSSSSSMSSSDASSGFRSLQLVDRVLGPTLPEWSVRAKEHSTDTRSLARRSSSSSTKPTAAKPPFKVPFYSLPSSIPSRRTSYIASSPTSKIPPAKVSKKPFVVSLNAKRPITSSTVSQSLPSPRRSRFFTPSPTPKVATRPVAASSVKTKAKLPRPSMPPALPPGLSSPRSPVTPCPAPLLRRSTLQKITAEPKEDISKKILTNREELKAKRLSRVEPVKEVETIKVEAKSIDLPTSDKLVPPPDPIPDDPPRSATLKENPAALELAEVLKRHAGEERAPLGSKPVNAAVKKPDPVVEYEIVDTAFGPRKIRRLVVPPLDPDALASQNERIRLELATLRQQRKVQGGQEGRLTIVEKHR
ncbi:hypothetical protein C8J56DRAFT_239471 [Mycena floridula]|nr:hypothetical protein C8J56DRAFT_239471 [Mycena floridula]